MDKPVQAQSFPPWKCEVSNSSILTNTVLTDWGLGVRVGDTSANLGLATLAPL